MRYQLVLQFRAESLQEFDELVVLEDMLIENMPSNSKVDGHDLGSDEFNIFFFTDQPEECFHAIKRTIRHYRPQQTLKAAYREQGHDSFVILWPLNLQEFKIV